MSFVASSRRCLDKTQIHYFDMLEKSLRIVVEAIKRQPYITIELPTGDRIKVTGKKVAHDVALAVQDHFKQL